MEHQAIDTNNMDLGKLLNALSEGERREALQLLQKKFCHPATGIARFEKMVERGEFKLDGKIRREE